MKTTGRCLVLLAACMICMQSKSQQAKNPLQLGDQYFAAGEYYTAASLYGQYLHPSNNQKPAYNFPVNVKGRRLAGSSAGVSRTDIKLKQADSYRLSNYWKEAAEAYLECYEQDSVKYADAMYWYAICQRSLGEYNNAEKSLEEYLTASNGHYTTEAGKELHTLRYIEQQLARPDSILVKKIQKLDAPNSAEAGVFAPALINGNQFLVSSTQPDSVMVNGINPYHSRLFSARLENGGLTEIMPVTIPGIELMTNQGAATMSSDGKYLYFSQWKKENGRTVSAIYYSIKQTGGWSAPQLLSSVNTSGSNSKQPFCSTDGKYLFFASDRPGGSGGFDIWYVPLNKDGSVGEPVNTGTAVNTAGDEQAPFYQNSSNTLVFSSNGHQGMGGYDLFAANGNESGWKMAENLGYPVNSSRDDIYFFAEENKALLSDAIFSSDRGSGCCLETYHIMKAPKSKQLSGVLNDCNSNSPIADAEVILKDASGRTWKTTTDANGKYQFNIGNESYKDLKLVVNLESYKETAVPFNTTGTDESDLLTDKLTSADICIEKKPEPAPEPVLVIKAENVVTVYFDFDRSLLKEVAVNKLDSIYQVMLDNPAATIQISGYTDGLGSEAYNKKLSDKRARACADYLVKKGIEKDRISFVSFGACCPVEMEIINGRDNPDGRSLNRRALINIKRE